MTLCKALILGWLIVSRWSWLATALSQVRCVLIRAPPRVCVKGNGEEEERDRKSKRQETRKESREQVDEEMGGKEKQTETQKHRNIERVGRGRQTDRDRVREREERVRQTETEIETGRLTPRQKETIGRQTDTATDRNHKHTDRYSGR